MKKHLRILALFGALAVAALPSAAQTAACNTATPPVCTMFAPSNPSQIKPQAVPTSPTAVTSKDAYISMLTFNNTSGGALVVTIVDGQASPIAVPGSGASIAAGTSYIIAFPAPGYWCPGGFTVSTTSTGMTMYGAWRQ
jgi:hypothetical protein